MGEARPANDSWLAPGKHDLPVPPALEAFMATGWAVTESVADTAAPVAGWAAERRDRLSERFPGERLVIPSGTAHVRSNDTEFRFRPSCDHVWLSGNQTSDAALVMEPSDGGHVCTLYIRPRSRRDNGEFWTDRNGELWTGRRPTLAEHERTLEVQTRSVEDLGKAVAGSTPTRVLRGVDASVDAIIEEDADGFRDAELSATLSAMRLVKDTWEVEQLQQAVDITVRGFEDCLHEWPAVLRHGERWLEGTFWRRARTEGNDVGYHSIVAAGPHATTLHWIENDGTVRPGDLVLLDMGVEAHSLYTADVTRTLPVSGRFTGLQRDLYTLVHRAQQAGIAAIRPGAGFREFHRAGMTVLAHGLVDLGLLASVDEALDADSMLHRRWTLCSSGLILGLDVHDCAKAPAANYLDGVLEAGQVLTVEPGLYFQTDDLLIPEELRGIGIRIEDDVLVTADGARVLSSALPATADGVEEWMAALVP